MDANIEISRFNNYFFNDTLIHDMVYYTSTSNQHMLFGTESNALSVLNLSACNVKVNRKLYVGAVQPYAPLLAQLEISDGGSNNQVVIYESSNNQQGMYLNSSNAEAKIGAFDWSMNQPIHLLLQQTGSNLGIGAGVSNPISLVHIKDNTTSNNILLEAGRVSDGTQEGFSALNFNGYSSNGDQRISTDKQRWRFKVDQTTTNEYAGIDSYDGTSEYYYITFSNKNVGINRPTPVARLHVQAETQDGTGDMTNSSNHPLTLQDTSGGPVRVVHLSTSSTASTVYNYETNKSIYWGESTDTGMYAFRGRFVAIQSNLSIGHSNPTTLLHMDSNSSNIVKFTNSTNSQGIYVGIENNNVVAGGGGLLWNASNAHIKFGTNNIERARLLSTGKLIIGSVSPSNADNQKALLELSDAGSNNQFMIYENSNNRLGLSICSSNNVSRITSYNWSTSDAIHLTLQNRGSNVGIGKDITNPLGLLHLRNDTSNNNVIIEAGRTSDGLNDGFSAINFNGYTSTTHKRINMLKNGWRIKVDQTGTNEAFSVEELKASSSNTYITLSNVNIGISNLNPAARIHIRGNTVEGPSADKTDTSNNPLTLEDTSGLPMRIVHKNANAAVSTIYNYEQAKNVYWGESNDSGIYVFRGRRLCLLSNFGINTINPQERMVLNAGNLYISTSGSIITENQLDINTSNQNIIINAVNAAGNISLRTGNVERAKITSTGIFTAISNISVGSSNPPANTLLYVSSNSISKIATTIENTNNNSGTASTELNLLTSAGSANALTLFLNSPLNTSDGGASNATIRNNCGNLRLSSKNNNALINMQSNGDITMSNNVFLTGNLRVAGPYAANPANVPLYINSNSANGYTVRFDNPSTASTSFTSIRLLTDTGQCSLFVNSSARSADGPVRSTTLKSDFGAMRLSSSNNNAFLFQDPTTSNTGINTSTPNYTLDVKGNINASNGIYTNNILRLDSSGNLTSVFMSGNSINSGTVAVSYGGTGANTLTTSKLLVGQGTSAVLAANNLHWNESLTRLGIGTSTPTTTLQVSGTVTATAFAGDGSSITGLSSTNVNAGTLAVNYGGTGTTSLAANKLLVGNGTSAILQPTNLHWDSTFSLLGIGTQTPSEKLDVNGSIITKTMTVYSGLANSDPRPAADISVIPGEIHAYGSRGVSGSLDKLADDGFMRISAGGGTNAYQKTYIDLAGYSTNTSLANTIVFGSGGAERMRITGNGNIGIGTATPIRPLVVSSSTDAYIVVQSTNNVTNANLRFETTNGAHTIYRNATTGTLNIYNESTNVLTISNNNVGIGTASPSYPLHVAGDLLANWIRASGNHGLYFESWGGGWTMYDATWVRSINNKWVYTAGWMRADAGFEGPRIQNLACHNFDNWGGVLWNAANSGTISQIAYEDYGGNVGSGWYFNYAGVKRGKIRFDGLYENLSDSNLKTNIQSMSNALQNVKKLNPVSFKWIDFQDMEKPNFGFLAQELEKIYPELVDEIDYHSESPSLRRKTANYIGLIPVLTQSIKELSAQMDELKATIEYLKSKL